MNEIPSAFLWIALLILMSAYFSGSETAMMSLNRYRLRHLVNEGHRGARKANRLLQRPDRLLGVILIGNNFVNFFAASIAAAVGAELLGQTTSTLVTPIVLTIVVLIFAEVTPKTVAAQRAETLAFPSAYILQPLLKICHPLVFSINAVSNFIAAPMIGRTRHQSDELSAAELKTVVNERTAIPRERQNMLLKILDLENATVDDIMVPKSEIVGIDIDDETGEIVEVIQSSQHTRLPVYREHIDNVLGMLHLRRAARFVAREEFTRADLIQETEEPYFVPKGTPLHSPVVQFPEGEAAHSVGGGRVRRHPRHRNLGGHPRGDRWRVHHRLRRPVGGSARRRGRLVHHRRQGPAPRCQPFARLEPAHVRSADP